MRKEAKHPEEKFKTIFNNSKDAILIYDYNFNIVEVNPACYKYSGYTADELMKLKLYDLIIPEQRDVLQKRFSALKIGETIEPYEFVLMNKNGLKFYVEANSHSIYYDDQKVILSIIRDITERKKVEIAFQESEIKFRGVFENSLDAIVVAKHGIVVFVNPAFLNMLGYKNEEDIIGKSVLEYIAPSYHLQVIENIRKRELGINSPHQYEVLGVKTNGEEFPFEVNATVYELNSELYTLAILRDITERKNIERKVYQSAIEAEECERSRIAKELHDGLGPLLSACILFLDTMAEDYPGLTSNPINQKLIHTLELSISTVKEISNNISPHVLRNFGLIQALKSYLSNMMCAKNIKIFFHSDIDIRMDTNIETNIYRIITELVNNTIKHACATIILIRLDLDDNGLLLNYLDDGIGFDPGRISGLHKGMGLVNIENRVKTLNGIFSLRTKPAEGVEINIEIANK